MERYGWMNAMMHFKTVCGANEINAYFPSYDGHDSNLNDRSIHIIRFHHIKLFGLKAGNSGYDQPNYNGPNLNLKEIFGQSKMN